MLDAIVYSSLFALMSIGLTLSYMTAKVPNFAHGAFITTGAYLTFTLFRLNNINPYVSLPASFLLGGAVGFIVQRGVIGPLVRRGANTVSLITATFAVGIAFDAAFGVFADLLANTYRIPESRYFLLANQDFSFLGENGLLFVAPGCLLVISAALYFLLTKTRFGVAMRAAVENPSLATVVGINLSRVSAVSWFLAGGLAAVAGNLFILRLPGNPHLGTDFTVAFFAASLLGGLASILGAGIGGIIIGAGEVLITVYAARLVGPWFLSYQPAVPLVLMIIGLLVMPLGIVSVDWRGLYKMVLRK
jgi:branched-chain amino acid transport system permease protein